MVKTNGQLLATEIYPTNQQLCPYWFLYRNHCTVYLCNVARKKKNAQSIEL